MPVSPTACPCTRPASGAASTPAGPSYRSPLVGPRDCGLGCRCHLAVRLTRVAGASLSADAARLRQLRQARATTPAGTAGPRRPAWATRR